MSNSDSEYETASGSLYDENNDVENNLMMLLSSTNRNKFIDSSEKELIDQLMPLGINDEYFDVNQYTAVFSINFPGEFSKYEELYINFFRQNLITEVLDTSSSSILNLRLLFISHSFFKRADVNMIHRLIRSLSLFILAENSPHHIHAIKAIQMLLQTLNRSVSNTLLQLFHQLTIRLIYIITLILDLITSSISLEASFDELHCGDCSNHMNINYFTYFIENDIKFDCLPKLTLIDIIKPSARQPQYHIAHCLITLFYIYPFLKLDCDEDTALHTMIIDIIFRLIKYGDHLCKILIDITVVFLAQQLNDQRIAFKLLQPEYFNLLFVCLGNKHSKQLSSLWIILSKNDRFMYTISKRYQDRISMIYCTMINDIQTTFTINSILSILLSLKYESFYEIFIGSNNIKLLIEQIQTIRIIDIDSDGGLDKYKDYPTLEIFLKIMNVLCYRAVVGCAPANFKCNYMEMNSCTVSSLSCFQIVSQMVGIGGIRQPIPLFESFLNSSFIELLLWIGYKCTERSKDVTILYQNDNEVTYIQEQFINLLYLLSIYSNFCNFIMIKSDNIYYKNNLGNNLICFLLNIYLHDAEITAINEIKITDILHNTLMMSFPSLIDYRNCFNPYYFLSETQDKFDTFTNLVRTLMDYGLFQRFLMIYDSIRSSFCNIDVFINSLKLLILLTIDDNICQIISHVYSQYLPHFEKYIVNHQYDCHFNQRQRYFLFLQSIIEERIKTKFGIVFSNIHYFSVNTFKWKTIYEWHFQKNIDIFKEFSEIMLNRKVLKVEDLSNMILKIQNVSKYNNNIYLNRSIPHFAEKDFQFQFLDEFYNHVQIHQIKREVDDNYIYSNIIYLSDERLLVTNDETNYLTILDDNLNNIFSYTPISFSDEIGVSKDERIIFVTGYNEEDASTDLLKYNHDLTHQKSYPFYSLSDSYSPSISNSNKLLYTNTLDMKVKIFDIEAQKVIQNLSNPNNNSMCNYNSPICNSTDQLIFHNYNLYCLRSGRLIHAFHKFHNHISGIFVSNEMEIICEQYLWDLRTFRLLDIIPELRNIRIMPQTIETMYYGYYLYPDIEPISIDEGVPSFYNNLNHSGDYLQFFDTSLKSVGKKFDISSHPIKNWSIIPNGSKIAIASCEKKSKISYITTYNFGNKKDNDNFKHYQHQLSLREFKSEPENRM